MRIIKEKKNENIRRNICIIRIPSDSGDCECGCGQLIFTTKGFRCIDVTNGRYFFCSRINPKGEIRMLEKDIDILRLKFFKKQLAKEAEKVKILDEHFRGDKK